MVCGVLNEIVHCPKVLENHFGPGKSWKLRLKVLEAPRKISLKVVHFYSVSLHVNRDRVCYVNKFI